MSLNNILRLEDRLLVTPRPLNAPLPRANASPLRIPVYDENRRPIPYMFRDRITGKISYEPPEPTAKTPKIALTTTSAADDWFNALTNPPPRRACTAVRIAPSPRSPSSCAGSTERTGSALESVSTY